jgi:pimeloyl-ACP methyl ester carboxylesterase
LADRGFGTEQSQTPHVLTTSDHTNLVHRDHRHSTAATLANPGAQHHPRTPPIGQSLGGLTIAAHPDPIHAQILIEAGPAGANPDLPSRIAIWPTPFESPAAAEEFFGHEAWARNLEQREDGRHPRVDRDTMIAAVTELATHSYWPEWDQTHCPTLVIRGANGTMPEREPTEMESRRPHSTTVQAIPDAAHDVHLDELTRVHAAVSAFLQGAEESVTRPPHSR